MRVREGLQTTRPEVSRFLRRDQELESARYGFEAPMQSGFMIAELFVDLKLGFEGWKCNEFT
jgi:hypothetical protein